MAEPVKPGMSALLGAIPLAMRAVGTAGTTLAATGDAALAGGAVGGETALAITGAETAELATIGTVAGAEAMTVVGIPLAVLTLAMGGYAVYEYNHHKSATAAPSAPNPDEPQTLNQFDPIIQKLQKTPWEGVGNHKAQRVIADPADPNIRYLEVNVAGSKSDIADDDIVYQQRMVDGQWQSVRQFSVAQDGAQQHLVGHNVPGAAPSTQYDYVVKGLTHDPNVKWHGTGNNQATRVFQDPNDPNVRWTEHSEKADQGDKAQYEHVSKDIKIGNDWYEVHGYQITPDGHLQSFGLSAEGKWVRPGDPRTTIADPSDTMPKGGPVATAGATPLSPDALQKLHEALGGTDPKATSLSAAEQQKLEAFTVHVEAMKGYAQSDDGLVGKGVMDTAEANYSNLSKADQSIYDALKGIRHGSDDRGVGKTLAAMGYEPTQDVGTQIAMAREANNTKIATHTDQDKAALDAQLAAQGKLGTAMAADAANRLPLPPDMGRRSSRNLNAAMASAATDKNAAMASAATDKNAALNVIRGNDVTGAKVSVHKSHGHIASVQVKDGDTQDNAVVDPKTGNIQISHHVNGQIRYEATLDKNGHVTTFMQMDKNGVIQHNETLDPHGQLAEIKEPALPTAGQYLNALVHANYTDDRIKPDGHGYGDENVTRVGVDGNKMVIKIHTEADASHDSESVKITDPQGTTLASAKAKGANFAADVQQKIAESTQQAMNQGKIPGQQVAPHQQNVARTRLGPRTPS